MPIKTFRGKLAMGLQKRLHLSTADGLTGYRIKKFELLPAAPGTANHELIGKVHSTDQTGLIASTVDFNDPTLIAVSFYNAAHDNDKQFMSTTIFDNEVVNQDVYVNIKDATGVTDESNYYLELEQLKLNINESTFVTLKNLRDNQQG